MASRPKFLRSSWGTLSKRIYGICAAGAVPDSCILVLQKWVNSHMLNSLRLTHTGMIFFGGRAT